jgi:hypothetical protein
MDTGHKSIIFNNYAQLSFAGPMVALYTDDPVVRLEEDQTYFRTNAQKGRLNAPQRPRLTGDPLQLFGTDLDWAYRRYIVHLLSMTGDGTDASLPLGLAPAQPISDLSRTAAPTEQDPQQLYLFNVIVALEWHPNQRYLQQLQWAFRRASDFLYDATDGFMAFGQVVFGGPEMLDCADIQIMASNRLLPRSWVSGLHEDAKYMPIRAGRGIWHKNNRVSVAWDEPEAYRTLVHEWCHYALELRDKYLKPHTVGSAPGDGTSNVLVEMAQGSKTVVIPQISLAIQSIMSTLEGTSELVPQEPDPSLMGKDYVWEVIKDKNHFPFTKEHKVLDGPEQLRLPLPCFRYIGTLAGDGTSTGPAGVTSSIAASQPREGLRFSIPKDKVNAEHCWVYVLHEPPDGPPSLIAQGTLDAQSEDKGFWLFGAALHDTVVLIGQTSNDATVVLGNVITSLDGDAPFTEATWQELTPTTFPMIDVLPSHVESEDQIAQISVWVTSAPGALPNDVWVFPLGDPAGGHKLKQLNPPNPSSWQSAPLEVPTLDGHVLLRWDDKLVISTFSQGGGPATNTPVGPPPISAGSSEGNLMLFFAPSDDTTNYSDVRVVTTLIHGMPYTVQGREQARSYAFSLASTKPLPKGLNPTLILYYDTYTAHGEGDFLVYHQNASGNWGQLPTYCQPGASFAAVPLGDEQAGGTLIADEALAQRIERYRLYWLPHYKLAPV